MNWETFKARAAKAYKSLTIWVNSAFAALASIAEPLKEYVPQIQPYLTAENFKRVFFGVIALNIILRFKTKNDLADK